jgi:CheY-like chemotaxis protein
MADEVLMILDDDRSFVKALATFLQDHGFGTVEVYNGQEALDRFKYVGIDLAIIDVHLPDISGIDVSRTIRRTGGTFPIILISGDDHPGMRLRCEQAGAQAFLSKPIDPQQLVQLINQALGLQP